MAEQLLRDTQPHVVLQNGTFFTLVPATSNALNVLERAGTTA